MNQVLARVVDRVKLQCAAGGCPVVVLDIDSTLFSTQERHRRILSEFAADREDEVLRERVSRLCTADFGWSVTEPLERSGGLEPSLREDLLRYWFARFFHDDWCDLDLPMAGAQPFVQRVVDAGGFVVYLTARPSPEMGAGTVRLLRRWRFPLLSGLTTLMMKPSADRLDGEWKVAALDRVERLGSVVATFDNEPGHVNAFAARFPEALHVWMDTVHSPTAPPLAPEAVTLSGFVV